jgi:hypothetical protein
MPCGTSSSRAISLRRLRSGSVGDLARDPAATRGVGHQHRIAAGQRQICCQRRALVAALFLDHLHEKYLAALDDFLNAVLLARFARRAGRNFLQRVLGTDGFDIVVAAIVVRTVVVVIVALFPAPARHRFGDFLGFDLCRHFGWLAVVFVAIFFAVGLILGLCGCAIAIRVSRRNVGGGVGRRRVCAGRRIAIFGRDRDCVVVSLAFGGAVRVLSLDFVCPGIIGAFLAPPATPRLCFRSLGVFARIILVRGLGS